jgi:hypothetical protein
MVPKDLVHVSTSAFDHRLEERYRTLGSACRKLAKSQYVWWVLRNHAVVHEMLCGSGWR